MDQDDAIPEITESREVVGARRYAELIEVDLAETIETHFSDYPSVEHEVERVKKMFPECPSAYVPSGALPAAALMAMLISTVAAIPAGVLAASICLAIGLLITAVLTALIAVLAICIVWCLPLLGLVLVVIATFVLQYCAAGFFPAWVVTAAGRTGKNRNTTAPGFISVLCSAVSVIGFMYLATYAFATLNPEKWFNEKAGSFLSNFGSSPYFWIVTGIGMLIAAFIAWVSAEAFVVSAKFCEKCEVYMQDDELPSVTLGGLKTLVELVEEGNFAVAAGIYQAAPGTEGKSQLYSCPECSAGFLDLEVSIEAAYLDKEGDEQDHEESWTVGSKELVDSEVEQLRNLTITNSTSA